MTLGQKKQLRVQQEISEPIARQEEVSAKEWVEGESPVDLDTVFGGVSMEGGAFFGEDLVGSGSISPVLGSGGVIVEEGDETLLEDVEPLVSDDMLGDKRKHMGEDPTSSQAKKTRVRCRPKAFVPRSKVGLKKRIGSRRVVDSTFEYIASSDDEIVDPTTGVSRRGVGYLFSTALKQLVTKQLTCDDMNKLGGMKLANIVKRMEKYGARFCGYGYGAALAACRERARRKLAEMKVKALGQKKDALIADIDLVREEAEEGFENYFLAWVRASQRTSSHRETGAPP